VGDRLFHFSVDPSIEVFVPQPVLVPTGRPAGMEWLNGPLVWAVTEERQATYLLPRDCPRILLWLLPTTTEADRLEWFGDDDWSMVAYVESAWLDRIRSTELYRYELPPDTFEEVEGEPWMLVSRATVVPTAMEPCRDLEAALARHGCDLRVVHSLVPLRSAWDTTLHASGIRLRHAAGWPVS
jgi:hypothetical protein